MLAYLKSLLFWPNISTFGRLMGTGDLRSLSDDRFESHNWGAFSPILIAVDKDLSPHQLYHCTLVQNSTCQMINGLTNAITI